MKKLLHMHSIRLDFMPQRSPSFFGVALFCIGLIVAIGAWRAYTNNRVQLQILNSKIEEVKLSAGISQSKNRRLTLSKDTLASLEAARQVSDFLLIPWDSVFKALEISAMEDVAVLSIEPNEKKRQLKIVAEAKDKDALFEYIQRLNDTPQLSSVYLLKHEILQDVPQQPIRFVVESRWEAL